VAVARATEGSRILSMLRWGLIPSWAKDPAIGHKLINARSEMGGNAGLPGGRNGDRSSPVLRVSGGLDIPDALGPCGANVGENVPDPVVAHDIAEARHAAPEPGDAARLHQRRAAELRVVEEQPVVVMPGVAGRIVGRGRQDPVLVRPAPVGLPLKLRAVAGGAVLPVQDLPRADEVEPLVQSASGRRSAGRATTTV